MNFQAAPSLPSSVLLALGRAGVEICVDPTDPTRVLFRACRGLPLEENLRELIRQHKSLLLGLLGSGAVDGCPRDVDVMLERLGVADDLELATHPGSPAWLIAMGESLKEQEDRALMVQIGRWTKIVQSVFGTPVRAEVVPPGERFEGEPDWGDPWTIQRSRGPRAGGAA